MDKDFDGWNIEKKKINSNDIKIFYHEREIWWCTLGLNVGFEQDGDSIYFKRPVLILKGLGIGSCIIIPITSSSNIHKLRIPIDIIDGKNASAVISQIRNIDTKRLQEKIGYLSKEKFEIIRKAIKDLL